MRNPALYLCALLLYLLPSCGSAPVHQSGDRLLTLRYEYGEPIRGKSFAWTGLGTSDTQSIAVANHWFVSNRLSLGPSFTATAFDMLSGQWITGGEIEGIMRWHFAEIDKTSFFWDWTAGYLHTSKKMPPNSTDWNFTFGFGPGVEIPLGGKWKLLSTLQYHHLSNAKGRETVENESQNEARFTIGFGMDW